LVDFGFSQLDWVFDPSDNRPDLVDPCNALRFGVVHIDVDEVLPDADSIESDSIDTSEDSVPDVGILGFDVGCQVELCKEMRAVSLTADGLIVFGASGTAVDGEWHLSLVSGFLELLDEFDPCGGYIELAAAATFELTVTEVFGTFSHQFPSWLKNSLGIPLSHLRCLGGRQKNRVLWSKVVSTLIASPESNVSSAWTFRRTEERHLLSGHPYVVSAQR